jgi:tetratricopeptide (TPR) repeat protein
MRNGVRRFASRHGTRTLAVLAVGFCIVLSNQLSTLEVAAAKTATRLEHDDLARRLLGSAVARESTRGGGVATLHESLLELAELALADDRSGTAELLLRRAVALEEGVSGTPQPKTLTALARILQVRGEYPEAVLLYERSLAMRGQLRMAPDLEHARTLEWIGEVYRDQGRFEESERLYKRALEVRERLLSAGDPGLAFSLYGMGMLCLRRGVPSRAELYLVRALALVDAVAPDREQDELRVRILSGLSQTYLALNQYGRSEASLDRALGIAEARDWSLARLAVSRDKALLARRRGDGALAERELRSALERIPGSLSGHPVRAVLLTDLAALHLSSGQSRQADELLDRAAAIAAAHSDHPSAWRVRNRIERLRAARDRRS